MKIIKNMCVNIHIYKSLIISQAFFPGIMQMK